uniref:ABC transporter substrate-binding protein n=1 Tax=Flavobacterium sp. TaxID=239 RepID=UPI00404A01E8
MITLKDGIGVQHTFKEAPKRIVSLVPSQTELLFDLGLEESLVGITKFCVHPYHLKSTKNIIGGTKNLHIDKIKALNPDLVIANKEENTLEIVQQLAEFCLVWVTDIKNVADTLTMITDFGKIFNKRTEAQKWIDKIQFAWSDFEKFLKDKPVQKVAYFIWANPYMVAGADTFINSLLEMNRFENIYANNDSYSGRYPEIVLKKIRLDGDPDLVLLSSEPFPFKDEHAFEIGRFSHHAKTFFVDGEMFSWYGSRLLLAFEYFKKLQEKL